MDNYSFSVDLGGMIRILSDHLYSTPKVFLRELLQNAVDAVVRRKMIDNTFNDPQIDIKLDEGKSLVFRDNGSGLTEEELHKFVSVIGQSSKSGDDSSFIGRFGIGLLSCFIVTDEIIMRTRSVSCRDKVLEWHGFADGKYSIAEIESDMAVGTEVIIRSTKAMEQYFRFDEVLAIIRYYALPMPYPIYIYMTDEAKVQANLMLPLMNGSEHSRMLELGRKIFGTEYDFVDYIPLESPTGLFSGAAYILPYTVSAAASGGHRFYLKNMLLTENGASVLPEWAFFVRCFLNTDKLRPTASREDFYKDELLTQAKEEISGCISSYLEYIAKKRSPLLEKIVSLHGTALKSVCAENEKLFDIFMPYFTFETNIGRMTGTNLGIYSGTIFYSSDIDMFRQLRAVFAEKNEIIVNTAYVHDKALLEMLVRRDNVRIEPVDTDLLENLLEDADDPERYSGLIGKFNGALREYDCRAMLKGFSPEALATLYSLSADGEIKRDIQHSRENSDDVFADMLAAFEDEIDSDTCAVLYINSKNPLIRKLADVSDGERLETFARILYVQSLISGGFPINSSEMNIMNTNLIKLIEWGI